MLQSKFSEDNAKEICQFPDEDWKVEVCTSYAVSQVQLYRGYAHSSILFISPQVLPHEHRTVGTGIPETALQDGKHCLRFLDERFLIALRMLL